MKKTLISLILVTASLAGFAQNEMMLENQSKKSFDETIEWIEKTAVDNNWKVIAIHDLQASMKKNGYEVLPVKVFAICQPEHAVKVLANDDYKLVSSMMPCRISVYEKSNGNTYISRMNTGILASVFEGVVKDVMTDTSAEIEEMIKPILK